MKKDIKRLINEEVENFKKLYEYNFYTEADNLILGNLEEQEDEEVEDFFAGGEEEEGTEELDKLGPEEEPAEEEEEEETEEVDIDVEPADDGTIELDVTELVKGSEEAKQSADQANEKIDSLLSMVSKLENQLKSMEQISSKIDSLETELEKRAPTPEEKIEMRSLDSYPYSVKLTDFWSSQEGQYDIMDKEDEEPKEYVLTQDDIDADYSSADVKSSFDEEDMDEL
jgi:hypothetical protein